MSRLVGWAFIFFAALCLVIVGDAHILGSRMDMNVEEKLDWISHELTIDRAVITRPSAITVLGRGAFEEIFVSLVPERSEEHRLILAEYKMLGDKLLAFYYPATQAIYISRDTATNDVLAHELTHHVLHQVHHGSSMLTLKEYLSLPPIPNNESIAIKTGVKYYCQSRWSLRKMCSLGLFKPEYLPIRNAGLPSFLAERLFLGK